MKKFVLETIDFTSIFKGYRIPIPFFLLCIDNITTKGFTKINQHSQITL